MSADVDLHRANRVGEWRPVSNVLHEVIGLPRPLTDVIAIYALDGTFYVHIDNVQVTVSYLLHRTTNIPDLYVGFVACGSESLGRGFVSYFGTVKELAVEDLHKTVKEISTTREIHGKLELEYYYDPYRKVKIEESVRLFDLSIGENGYRKVYRQVGLR